MDEDRPVFLIVYNKPSSSDYCRGCLMDSYSSDSGTSTSNSVDRVIERCVSLLSKKLGCGEDGYNIKIYKEGCGFNNYMEFYNHDGDCSSPWWGDGDEYDEGAVNNEDVEKIKQGVKEGIEQKKIEQKEKERKEEKTRKARDHAEKKREYERLKKEFE